MINIKFNNITVNYDKLTDFLLQYGVLSTSLSNLNNTETADNTWFDEPGYGNWSVWENPVLNVILDESIDPDLLAKSIQSNFALNKIPTYSLEPIPDKDWAADSQDYHPHQICKNLWVYPEDIEFSDPAGINIIIKRTMAFGTGSHATTRLCLRWLMNNINGGERVLDYGCGSGILSITAAKLGAELCLAVDIDPQALNMSIENGKLNQVKISTFLPEELKLKNMDIIVANILANPIKLLKKDFIKLLADRGHLVLSGIMESQIDDICEEYDSDFSQIKVDILDGWGLITGLKNIN